MRSILHCYLARQLGTTLLITAPSLCALVALFQTMRLLPLVATSGITLWETLQVYALLLVPLSAVTLPAAAVISLQIVFARMESDSELLALRAIGISSVKLAIAPGLVCLAVAVSAGVITVFAEPLAYNSLQNAFGNLLVRSMIGRIRPGLLVEAAPRFTVLAAGRSEQTLSGVFIEDRRLEPSARIFASSATISPLTGRPAARVILGRGAIRTQTPDRQNVFASFSRLEMTLELDDAARLVEEIVPPRISQDTLTLAGTTISSENADTSAATFLFHRRLALAPGALGLCLLAFTIALIRPISGKPWAVTVGAALILVFHLLTRFGEAMVDARIFGASYGGWLPTIVCWTTLGIVSVWRRL